MIRLTPEERQKFAAWLRQDIQNDRLIYRRLEETTLDKTGSIKDIARAIERVKTMNSMINSKLNVATYLETISNSPTTDDSSSDAE